MNLTIVNKQQLEVRPKNVRGTDNDRCLQTSEHNPRRLTLLVPIWRRQVKLVHVIALLAIEWQVRLGLLENGSSS